MDLGQSQWYVVGKGAAAVLSCVRGAGNMWRALCLQYLVRVCGKAESKSSRSRRPLLENQTSPLVGDVDNTKASQRWEACIQHMIGENGSQH
jgi:hypothetical protein